MKFSLYCHLITTVIFGVLYVVVPSAFTIPLVVLSLGVFAYNEGNRYATFISVGMLFSAFGDISLRLENGNFLIFLCGVVNYLIAHLCYIKAYLSSGIDFTNKLPIGLFFVAYCATMLSLLCPGVDNVLIPAVIIYAMIICTMAFLSTNRYFTAGIHSPSRTTALIGSLVFLSSDSILSMSRFRTSIPHSDLIIWITYCIGQMFIAMSAKDPYHEEKNSDDNELDATVERGVSTSPLMAHSESF